MQRLGSFDSNPIIVKELRSRMRGGRAFLTLTAALLLMAVAGYGLYRVAIGTTQYSTTPLSPQIGQVLFTGLVFLELMIIAAVTPSVTAGAISGEIEKQTYEMLLATPLPPGRILWGKLIAALGYVFILIFAAIPLASVVFLFGGVAVREMIKALVILIVVAVLFGVIGLFASAAFKRSGRATAAAYIGVLILTIGPLFAAVGAGMMRQGDPPRWILAPSPITALASALSPSVNVNNLSSMFWMLGSPIYWIMGNPQISQTSIPRPTYHYSVPLYLGLTIILYLIATRLVRPVRRWRLQWAEALVGLVVVLGFFGLVTVGYAATTNRYENVIIATPETVIPEPVPGQPVPGQPVPGAVEPPVIQPQPEGEQPYPGPYPAPDGEATPTPYPPPKGSNPHAPVDGAG